jgi:hypothetical protein
VTYTAEKPKTTPTSDELRRTIPGWGVDLAPEDRPSYPKEQFLETGAHWDFPERQQPRGFREQSTEHKVLPPVFGTAQPLRGLSGAIRRYAYTYSEGQTAHWLLLMAGDRIDVMESRVEALLRGRPDNPITETGVLREFRGGAYRTRFGQHRADLAHLPIDGLMWAAPYLLVGGSVFLLARSLARPRRAR